MYKETIEYARECLKNNIDLELVEIINSSLTGTPRKEGAFMFVDKDAKSFGTIGGGNVEYMATLYAKELLLKKIDGHKEYNLSMKESANIGMVCGGDIELRLIYLTNNQKSFSILDEICANNSKNYTVYIFGAGHVAKELAKILYYIDFEIVVWDDRIEFANEQRFECAKNIICEKYNNDFAIVMTRGHVSDYEVVKQLLSGNFKYIGAIGSMNKIKVMKEQLAKDGFSKEKIDNICMPIGIQIAAETPEEIAISIASELILFRSRFEERKKVMNGSELVSMYKNRGINI